MAFIFERVSRDVQRLFPWVWRLAFFVLPWQTRWFREAPLVAGFPWEEGRSSVYVSWFFLLATVVLSLFLDVGKTLSKREQKRRRSITINALIPFLIFATLVVSPVSRATLQWWMEVGMLYAFFRILAERVPWREAVLWFVLALFPSVVLGISQAFTQAVMEQKWLGVATQIPATKGVAVVEALGGRWLRAYGGFPHPNIFGGWLVVALVLILLRLRDVFILKREKVFYYCTSFVFGIALALTYSRSAWMGCVLAALVIVGVSLRASVQLLMKRRSFFAISLMAVSCALVFAWRPALILTRAQSTTHLEQKSVNERIVGMQNAWRVVQARPLWGAGLGGGAWAIAELDARDGKPASFPILPHAVPLLALLELGILGSLLLVSVVWTSLVSAKRSLMRLSKESLISLAILFVACLPSFLLDHYAWSYWSGKALFAYVLFFGWLLQNKPNQV